MIPIPLEPPLIQLNIEEYLKEHNTVVEENLFRLPEFFDDNYQPFIGFHHLHSLYRESYFCILHGFYHAGIIVMSQLIEEILREIIRTHTGVPNGAAFEGLLSAMSQQSKVTGKPYLIHPDFVKKLIKIKEDIRNPYTHLRYKKILRGQTIPAAKIQVGTDPGTIVDNIKKGIQEVTEGRIPYEVFDPSGDPVMAAVLKEDIDKQLAIQLAWNIYPLYWVLMEVYLNKDVTAASLQQFGSIWEPKPKNDPSLK